MAVSKEELLHQLDVLIPEFMGESILDGMCSESRKGVAVRAVKSVKWIIIIVVGAVVTGLLTDLPTWTLALCAAAVV